jgi:peptidoglycan hydrolase CwlO-like protein
MKKLFIIPLLALLLLHAYAFSEECILKCDPSQDASGLPCLLDIQNQSLDCLETQWMNMQSQIELLKNNSSGLKDSLNSISVIMAGLETNLKLSRNHLKMAKDRTRSIKAQNAELKDDYDRLKGELDKASKELKKSEFKKDLYFYGGISIIAILTGAIVVIANN